jgi:hypothetical protein
MITLLVAPESNRLKIGLSVKEVAGRSKLKNFTILPSKSAIGNGHTGNADQANVGKPHRLRQPTFDRSLCYLPKAEPAAGHDFVNV